MTPKGQMGSLEVENYVNLLYDPKGHYAPLWFGLTIGYDLKRSRGH